MRTLWAHLDELTAKHVDVDIRGRQDDIPDLGGIDFLRMATPRNASAASQVPIE